MRFKTARHPIQLFFVLQAPESNISSLAIGLWPLAWKRIMLGPMETTIQIKGMSCMHCVRAVEGALKAVEGVRDVSVKVGEAKVVADDAVQENVLKEAIRDEGFEVL